jgi:hypothetical protein
MYDYLAIFAHENINFFLFIGSSSTDGLIGLSVFSVTMLKMALNICSKGKGVKEDVVVGRRLRKPSARYPVSVWIS